MIERPIIITGPPRSGTTMFARVMSHLGVFLGYNINTVMESWFWININEHIMFKLGCTWDNPERTHTSVPMEMGLIEETITSSNLWQEEHIFQGFKEPRYLLVMDVWEDIWDRLDVNPFIIRMKRHPMDIAYSLFQRERNKSKEGTIDKPDDRSLHNNLVGPTWPGISNRLKNLETALQYAKKNNEMFRGKEDLLVDYEKFVNRPVRWLHETICENLDLSIGPHRERRIREFVSKDRAYAYRDNEKLVEFWEEHCDG